MSEAERWTAEQAGAHCTTKRSPNGVPGATYRRLVELSGAPDAVGRDVKSGAKLYDPDAVRRWHANRPGQGARTDRKEKNSE
jgi:hypothetical protein